MREENFKQKLCIIWSTEKRREEKRGEERRERVTVRRVSGLGLTDCADCVGNDVQLNCRIKS